MMSDYTEFYKARKIITDILEKDLVGPVTQDECLSENPAQYYIMGKLYPQSDQGEVLDLARNPLLENEIESYDASVSLSNEKNPSSMGVTFTLSKNVKQIKITGSYAFYLPIPFEDAADNEIDVSKWKNADKHPKEFWKRKSYTIDHIFDITNSTLLPPYPLLCGLQLHIYTHMIFESGERVVTVALVNTNTASNNDYVNLARLTAFQPVIVISGFDGASIFTNVNHQENVSSDPELQEMNMLYSDTICYAQGHGCSVQWEPEQDPLKVYTSWFPSFNLRQMMASQKTDKTVLSMKYLSEGNAEDIINRLYLFVADYTAWIDELKTKIPEIEKCYWDAANANIKKCEKARNRMQHSIDLLADSAKKDKLAIRAFQYANEAMLMQRRQTLLKAGKHIDDNTINWYPFQLAFILHEISSFIEPQSKERNIVDLLWFPTGGGKTEAYLGIAAFVIFLRRLCNPFNDGVTVIMRYTLRLLTLQQFERASMLICACELIRKEKNLGGSEISIGLWVGGKLTPNTLKEARSSINKQQRGALVTEDESNPYQVKVCPWCGHRIEIDNYSVRINEKRMRIRCGNEHCVFHEKDLPLHIIDEEIYEYLPTFLIATVDKFAQIPLSDKPAALFGISSKKNPPELIIQDELHLISGPLGTMTGIYEAGVTKLCEKDGIGAKVIASTATIRNAKRQIRALYGRDFMQFPPQGISAKDSYFAVESTDKDRPARQYCGVMGIGTTATTTLIRVNAALLFATRYLSKLRFSDLVVDNFWTIIGYFNSLRELGGATTQILDDVQSRFNYLANTKFAFMTPKVDATERYDNLVELTSRMDNAKITDIIQDRLKRSFHDGKHSDVYDFVLASNMISVGVDVGRLGVMTVTGQPKTNAEYIQATSRVGRDNPGLVITVYNPARSRDRSHYEQFIKYHSALYRYVEATSLTPFADRARDRGLHALFVSLCRYLVPGLLTNEEAVNFDKDAPEVKKIENTILNYVQIVDPNEVDAVKTELQDIEEAWQMETTGQLVYRSFKDEKSLLKSDIESDRFRTMNSMRNVDAQAGIYLLRR